MNSKLSKAAIFTDIHFGKKANSQTHNEDCLNFVKWFCDQVRQDPEIDHVCFLGDWNENRSSLNISTLNYSYKAAKLLNDLNIPVFFLIGNHDLYYRNSREIHSVIPFNEFANFVVVEEPLIAENIGDSGVLFCPYLFHEEYKTLTKYLDMPVWMGHFEFKGFEVTGYGLVMPTGPDPKDFEGPKHIFSGHFHKRQAHENIVYIGNAFPMDYGDAGDFNRGMAIHDYKKDETTFKNWDECPKYVKTHLTSLFEVSNRKNILFPNARVKCVVDVPITFEESTHIKQKFMEEYQLREFSLEESSELQQALSETEMEFDFDDKDLADVNELVIKMLEEIDSEHIDNQLLINTYKGIKSQ